MHLPKHLVSAYEYRYKNEQLALTIQSTIQRFHWNRTPAIIVGNSMALKKIKM